MEITQDTWRSALLHYARTCRAIQPLPSREVFSAEEEARCQIIGGSLINWLQEEFPQIIRQQQAMHRRQADAPLPLVVITTETAGLVAAEDIIGESDEMVYLLPDEFNAWEAKLQDNAHAWNIHYWSAFHPVTAEEWDELVAKGIEGLKPLTARWHVVGCLWGTQAGTETMHLWEWAAGEFSLVAPGYREII